MQFSVTDRLHEQSLPAIVDVVIQGRNTIAICADQDQDEIVGLAVEDVRIETVARFFSSTYDLDVDVVIESACSITLSNKRVV